MCILPNFATGDLAALKQNRRKETKKAEAETVEIVIPEKTLVQNSI
jgi:hypothetical protein